jgi:hypothetical protein
MSTLSPNSLDKPYTETKTPTEAFPLTTAPNRIESKDKVEKLASASGDHNGTEDKVKLNPNSEKVRRAIDPAVLVEMCLSNQTFVDECLSNQKFVGRCLKDPKTVEMCLDNPALMQNVTKNMDRVDKFLANPESMDMYLTNPKLMHNVSENIDRVKKFLSANPEVMDKCIANPELTKKSHEDKFYVGTIAATAGVLGVVLGIGATLLVQRALRRRSIADQNASSQPRPEEPQLEHGIPLDNRGGEQSRELQLPTGFAGQLGQAEFVQEGFLPRPLTRQDRS